MIANRLEDELQEAIQRFADRNWNGALEMAKVTEAVARLTGAYLAEIPTPSRRVRAFNIFMELTAREISSRASYIGENGRQDA
jgi:hypothetical protein